MKLIIALLMFAGSTQAFAQSLVCHGSQVNLVVKIEQLVVRKVANTLSGGNRFNDAYLITNSFFSSDIYGALEDSKIYNVCALIDGQYISIYQAVEVKRSELEDVVRAVDAACDTRLAAQRK